MRVTPTKLRQNIYSILDEVLEKGIPVEVERKGKILRIVPESKRIWDRIPQRTVSTIVGDPEEFKTYEMDWEKDWREPQNLIDVAREYQARKRRARKKRA